MYCKHCGKQISDDSSYCQYCGKEVSFQEIEKVIQGEIPLDNKDKKNYSPTLQRIGEENITSSNSGDKIKTVLKTFFKELGVCIVVLFFAFLVKIVVGALINATPYPIISDEDQQAFNQELFDRRRDSGVVTYCGDIASQYLQIGSFKYDNELGSNGLYDVNEFRKRIIQKHADETSTTIFWILLIGSLLVRYFVLLLKWLNQKDI